MIIGIGTDIIEIDRIKKALNTHPKLANRLFTAGELEYCSRRGNTFASLAARFAAKEAVSKALGTGIEGFSWLDIEIENNIKGKPEVKLNNRASEKAFELGVIKIEISLSHSKEYAVAMVILLGG